jgi:predicted membrane protein
MALCALPLALKPRSILPAHYNTYAFSINTAGMIAGYYEDISHFGFIRAADGTFTTFNAPGAGIYGTVAYSINTAGAVAGWYFDANSLAHGFVRAADGTITSFDPPGAGTAAPRALMAGSSTMPE